MDFDDKISRADFRYQPPCKPLSDVMAQTIKTPEDRELLSSILENYIDE
jgi:hypothetical protein